MADLKPGTYRLTRDVTNPRPDRRVKHDWRCQPVIRAGTVFAISHWTRRVTDPSEPAFITVEMRQQDSWSFETTEHTSELFELIVPWLAPLQEEPSDYLLRVGYERHGGRLLDILAKAGKITLADVEAALEAYKAE